MYRPSLQTKERVTSRVPAVEFCPAALGRHGGHRCIGFAPEHGVVGQRAVEQRCLDVPAGTVGETPVERGQRADEGEVGRTEAGLGQPFEDRPLAVTGLLGHGADKCMDEGFVCGDIAQRTVAAEPRDGTRHEARIDRPQCAGPQTEVGGGTGAPGLHEHVGLGQQGDQGGVPRLEDRRCACSG